MPIFDVLKILQAAIKAVNGCPRNGRGNRKWISGGLLEKVVKISPLKDTISLLGEIIY